MAERLAGIGWPTLIACQTWEEWDSHANWVIRFFPPDAPLFATRDEAVLAIERHNPESPAPHPVSITLRRRGTGLPVWKGVLSSATMPGLPELIWEDTAGRA